MKNKKSLIIFGIIFIILFFSILFFVINQNKKILEKNNSGTIFSGSISKEIKKENIITLIEDKRNPDTDLSGFLENLKNQVPDISGFKIKKLDFSDISVKEFLEKNNINTLPAIIFSTKDFLDDTNIKNYLIEMETGEYFLQLGAFYNPFSASERGFSVLNKNIFDSIMKDSFFENGNDKKIIWLEYSDLACSYCQKFHESGIINEILKTYDGQISKTYNHLRVHKGNHYEVLECIADQKGETGFFKFLKIFFENKVFEYSDLEAILFKGGYNVEKIKNCISEGKKSEKIDFQTERAFGIFGIKSTPNSVFINSETLEYKIVSGFSEKLGKDPYIKAIESIK